MSMWKTAVNIVIVENVYILYEGLVKAILQSGVKGRVTRAENLKEAEKSLRNNQPNIIIINPAAILYDFKELQVARTNAQQPCWIGYTYQFFEEKLLSSRFNAVITVFDTPEKIAETIQSVISEENNTAPEINEKALSEREIEVLQQLALGLSNKEIAEKLNISTHTAITHRKNISQKTGIKTVSGLTIYAVVNKHITI